MGLQSALSTALTGLNAAVSPFLTIEPTATAEFVGNVINTSPGNMPDDSDSNVTATGNLRIQ